MTLPSESPLPTTESVNLAVAKRLDSFLQSPAPVDLVLVQDGAGFYLSFYWREAEGYGLATSPLIGQSVNEPGASFIPVAIAPYLKRIQQVLETATTDQFSYPFRCGKHNLVFDLSLSPTFIGPGAPSTVTVMGRFLHTCTPEQALKWVDNLPRVNPTNQSNRSSLYQKRLNQLAWNVRRTLELDTIWQQTAEGLGETLDVNRCLVCPYLPGSAAVSVVAEYRHSSLQPMLGLELILENEPHLVQALTTLEPVEVAPDGLGDGRSLLIVPTCHKDQPNGLIVLHQSGPERIWDESEISLIRELADQIGTGVAHANTYAESRNLAAELQRVNADLRQQHQELEESRKQAEEASRLKSEFLANTSHELRTPLNGMIGFLKLIMDGMADDPEEQNEFIQEAYRSAVHLLNIINDILDIAKIEAGKMQLECNPVKLDDLLTDVEKFTQTQALQKHLSFEIRTPATHDPVVLYGNYQRLLQVMLNLVGNAIKFTHEGGITITAEVIPKKMAEQSSERTGLAKISVADTGIGVSLEKQDKLFQSFSQVDGSRTRQYGGTGLGLAISQKLVEAMNGIVNFYSLGEGLGSTVTFTVPLYQDPVMIATQPMDDEAELEL